MYLKELTLTNFRKFSNNNNTVSFVHGQDIYKGKEQEEQQNSESVKKENVSYNFSENTTLVVGKNNSGKTTVIRALEKISKLDKMMASDFNFHYLGKLLENLLELKKESKFEDFEINNNKKYFPQISFEMKIGFKHNEKDLLSNIYPVLQLEDLKENKNDVSFDISWVIKEQHLFLEKFIKSDYSDFNQFCELINETEFAIKYFRLNKEIKNFNIKKLLNLEVINANKIRDSKNSLSKAFNKILEYRFKYILENEVDGELEENEKKFVTDLDKGIKKFNLDLSGELEKNINKGLNDALKEVVSDDIFKIILTSDLDIDKLLNNILKYAYGEGDYTTSEENFGLGYSNLVMVIADLIDYLSKYQKPDYPESTINLIVIEEPEVHMHPQMQENFILNVEKMVNSLLLNLNKDISTQIIITSHSPHIVNSKIHSGNSFDNINYINGSRKSTKAIVLKDGLILEGYNSTKIEPSTLIQTNKKHQKQLAFLKKHIKFQISEIFFSDAVIFVEGATEYTLLPYYLQEVDELNKKYITIAMVDGAHAHVYFPLLSILEIPSLIITDIDINREEDEKREKNGSYLQMDSKRITGRETTNNVLKSVLDSKIEEIIKKDLIDVSKNIMIATQNNFIHGYLPTSFEEAYILENLEDMTLIKALKATKPNLSKGWVNENIIDGTKSFEIQMKLGQSKVEFPTNVLFNSMRNGKYNLPELPDYIKKGFTWLKSEIEGEENG